MKIDCPSSTKLKAFGKHIQENFKHIFLYPEEFLKILNDFMPHSCGWSTCFPFYIYIFGKPGEFNLISEEDHLKTLKRENLKGFYYFMVIWIRKLSQKSNSQLVLLQLLERHHGAANYCTTMSNILGYGSSSKTICRRYVCKSAILPTCRKQTMNSLIQI